MKVLVTGATGGLGELIINYLLAEGIEVVATSRNEEKAKNCSFFPKVIYKPYNISSPEILNLFEYFERPDTVIHLAWEKLTEYKNPEHLTTILDAHKAFVKNLFDNGLKDFTGVGTCYEYGLKEGVLTETDPANPTLPYPEGKNLLREYTEELAQTHDKTFKWVRIFYVFGEVKERKNLYTLLNEAIKNKQESFNMSGGEQIRDFLTPAEIAQTIMKIALQQIVLGTINCCSGNPVKLKEFVLAFLRKQNSDLKLNLGFYPYADYEPMETWGSVEKLNKALGARRGFESR